MNFSIITDFGCPFKCSFCITNSQETKKEFKFTKEDFEDLKKEINKHKIKRITLSGGGDPLYIHSKEIKDFYSNFFNFSKENNIEIHVHTNTISPISIINNFDKIVISINENNFMKKYKNWDKVPTKRFVHVSDGKDIELIKRMLEFCPKNAQFTVKQMDDFDDILFDEIKKLVNNHENGLFLASGDYNLYYVLNEKKTYKRFKDIKFKG